MTRVSIFCEGWIAGSSPGMTACALTSAAVFLVDKSLGLHRQMHLVLERRILVRHQQSGIVRDRLAERDDPGTLVLGEIGQHVAVHQLLDAGVADPKPHAAVVVADMRRNRAQTVVSGNAAADLDADLGGRQFDFILKHGDLACPQLEETRGLLNRTPRLVHEGRGAQQHHSLAIERAFRGFALKTPAPWCETMTPRDFIDGHETDVVPVMRVFRAGIAETNKEQHDAASRVRLLLLVAARRRGAGRGLRTARGYFRARRSSSARRGSGSSAGC